ncbi:MAG: hypothetical protein AB7Q00_14740 [Phycisphaerales bacterium]
MLLLNIIHTRNGRNANPKVWRATIWYEGASGSRCLCEVIECADFNAVSDRLRKRNDITAAWMGGEVRRPDPDEHVLDTCLRMAEEDNLDA